MIIKVSTIKNLANRLKKNKLKNKERKNSIISIKNYIEELNDLLLHNLTKQIQASHPNPLNAYGKKCFSQSDEDGITLEILRRMKKINNGFFAELGVGDGTENNTLLLSALGWKGFWVGGNKLAFNPPKNNKFLFLKEWITRENIASIFSKGFSHFKNKEIDLISVDLDGNDFYVVEKLLKANVQPKIFILEYNAKFPPPIKFKINYNPKHQWAEDDYFGCSLSSYNDLLSSFDYKLLCCNSHTGANSFFIKKKFAKLFKDVPTDIKKIYSEPRYILHKKFVHKKSIKLIEQILS